METELQTAVVPATESTTSELPAPTPKPAVEFLPCRFEGCVEKMHPSKASVPSLKAVQQAQDRPVAPADLLLHVFCQRHSNLARKQGLYMFSYTGSLAELKRRETEESVAANAFGRYGQMRRALEDSRPARDDRRPARGNFGRR